MLHEDAEAQRRDVIAQGGTRRELSWLYPRSPLWFGIPPYPPRAGWAQRCHPSLVTTPSVSQTTSVVSSEAVQPAASSDEMSTLGAHQAGEAAGVCTETSRAEVYFPEVTEDQQEGEGLPSDTQGHRKEITGTSSHTFPPAVDGQQSDGT